MIAIPIEREEPEEQLYKTVKFSQTEPPETLEEDLTLEDAKKQCNGEGTSGEGWFVGFDKM